MILMQIKLCKEPNAFQTLCELLASTGNKDVSDSLLFDKDRIRWGECIVLTPKEQNSLIDSQ
jgi:hypothetical protein